MERLLEQLVENTNQHSNTRSQFWEQLPTNYIFEFSKFITKKQQWEWRSQEPENKRMSQGDSNHPKISVHTPSNHTIVTEQQVPRGKAATYAVTWKFPNREKYKKTRFSIQGFYKACHHLQKSIHQVSLLVSSGRAHENLLTLEGLTGWEPSLYARACLLNFNLCECVR